MTVDAPGSCDDIRSEIESMMDSVDVARLTDGQYAEVKKLKGELDEYCAKRDRQNAKRTESQIVAIIKEGPPGYG